MGMGTGMGPVGCAGILVADTFAGPLPALPAAGELVTLDRMPMSVGGCAANVAIGLARQGIAAEVAGVVGRDAAGGFVTASLRREGVGVDRIRVDDGLPTSQTVVLLVDGEDRRYLHVVGANAGLTAEDLAPEWLATLGTLCVGGLFAMPGLDCRNLAGALAACRSLGVRTVVDVVIPAGMDAFPGLGDALPFVDLLLPNDDEAARLTGEPDPERQARALRAMGAGAVVVTLGERGAFVLTADDGWWAEPFPVDAVDPSGGGDAFAAGLIAALHRGLPLREAVAWAQAVGASATRAVGTTAGVFTEAETRAFLAARRGAPHPGDTG